MLKYLRTFLIYDFIIGILYTLCGKISFNHGYLQLVSVLILSTPVPVVFAIKYGQHVAIDHSISFFSKLMLGLLMFLVNYATYLLLVIKELRKDTLLDLSCETLLPAMLLTSVFYSCIIYPKLAIPIMSGTKLGRLWETLKPFCAYISIVALLILYHTYILGPYSSRGYSDFFILITLPILDICSPLIFGIWYGRKVANTNSISTMNKISISGFMFITNFMVYYIPYINRGLKPYISEGKIILPTFIKNSILPPTVFLTISFIISFSTSTLLHSFKKKEAAI